MLLLASNFGEISANIFHPFNSSISPLIKYLFNSIRGWIIIVPNWKLFSVFVYRNLSILVYHSHMRSYLQGTRHLKETTINLRLASLKNYFQFLEEEKYIKNNPAKAIKKIKIQSPAAPKSLDEQTYRALRRHIYRCGNKAHIAMFEIFTRCGVRNFELINIRIADIDITERKGNLKVIGKQNKVRYIPLHGDVRDAI